MSRPNPICSLITASLGLSLLAGCEDMTAVNALPSDPDAYVATIAEVKDNLDAASPDTAHHAQATESTTPHTTATHSATPVPAMITGLGFAQVARQEGRSLNQKRLLALRAARMDALRNLTEQVHGIHIAASTTISGLVVQDDHLQALVEGTIRGARTVRITPKGNDGYEVELALDADTVAYILRVMKDQL